MLFWIIAAITIVLVVSWLKTPTGKGFLGERKVRKAIGKTKPGVKYVINDLTISSEEGKSSQIDHLLINQAGIFVIETKNYSGRIYGNEKQREWTQVLAYGKCKNSFYNPLRQNATHLYRLAEVVGKEIPLYSAIVFVQGNISFISAPHIYTVHGLKKLIKAPSSAFLTQPQQEALYQKLLAIKEAKTISKKQHLKNIHDMQQQINDNICPRCGNQLLKKDGQYGSFWGCSNYPNCKFTKK